MHCFADAVTYSLCIMIIDLCVGVGVGVWAFALEIWEINFVVHEVIRIFK